jgi:hypothetical protein
MHSTHIILYPQFVSHNRIKFRIFRFNLKKREEKKG